MNRLVHSAAVFAFALLVAVLRIDPAYANRRAALVIGNSTYQNVAVLANPASDARAVSEKFKEAGFEVVYAHFDLGNLAFKRALRQFEDAAVEADIAVVFFAGHGIEIRGTNYMVPVDAKLASDRDAEDEAITLDRLLQAVEGSKRLGLVILDACRDNPFLRNMKRTRMTAVRAAAAGLTIVEPTSRNTLIAYAAKAGAFAEDGDGKNSPFTGALLKNLFVPGLDVRLAFGRIRDEVLKDTRQRQEPFVSGSLGGAHISIVNPPAVAAPAAAAAKSAAGGDDAAGQRSDYALVEKIGTVRAWEIFLTQHPTGFYADLARQHLAKLEPGDQTPGNPARKADGPVVAALEPPRPPASPRPSNEEQRAWDRIRDTSNTAAFRDFIKRYPASVLANTAQTRLEALERAVQEREEQARIEREAKAAEAKRLEEEKRAQAAAAAEHQRLEREAAAKRAEEDRLLKQAEAERQKAEREAAVKRAEAERLAKAAEAAERQRIEREAAAKRAEEDRLVKQAEAERQRAEREAAAKRAEEARLAKLSEFERQKAEREAALKRAEEERIAKTAEAAERQRIEREAAAKRAEADRLVKQAEAERQRAEAERQKAEQAVALKAAEAERLAKAAEAAERQRAEREAAAKRAEEERRAKAAAEAERQQALREAALKRAEEDRTAKPPAPATDVVRAAQTELARLGCFAGPVDGNLTGATKDALKRYQVQRGKPGEAAIDDELVSDLKSHASRACPLVCPPGRVAEGEQCVAARKPATPVARQKDEDEKPARRQNARQQEESRPAPRVRQEAAAPRQSSGGRSGGRSGGGGGGGFSIGVGF